MADITSTASQIASCSFCDKPNTDVERLVAGAGVYICNECVELSATLIADTAQTSPEERARLIAERDDRSPEQILATLPSLGRSLARVESDVAHWIARLREQGTDWVEIADGLGMSVEDARRRFDATGHR
jgi:ribosomal protein L37AE/L43A